MNTILFFTDLNSGSRLPMLRGAKERASHYDFQVQVVELARVQVAIPKILAYWKPAGCIIEGSSHIKPLKAIRGKLPIVHIDPNASFLAQNPCYTVTNDNAGIADRALKVLLRCGAEHFAYVGWTRYVNWSTARFEAFRDILAELGKECHSLLDPWTLGDVSDFAKRLIPWLKALPKPCGIFAANDDIASVILDTCRMANITVPDDIAVIGVDDEPSICETTKPSLSSVRPDFAQAGALAVDLLIRRLANDNLPAEHLIFSPKIVTLRQSTRRITQHNPKITAALELIRREACSGLKAADVVKFLGVSERHAETRFKQATGRRITEEITEVRLVRVLELLRNPKQSITPIANLCGWETDVYLKRLFKKRFNCTMREWREQNLI